MTPKVSLKWMLVFIVPFEVEAVTQRTFSCIVATA
jgi:hypothetical protein